MTTNKLSVPTTEQRKEAANALGDVLFGGKNDDAIAYWLHKHLQDRLPGAEEIMASDRDSTAVEIADKELPAILIGLFTTEIFAGGSAEEEGGYHLRDKILDVLFEKYEYSKIRDIWSGATQNKNTIDEKNKAYAKDRKSAANEMVKELKVHSKHPWFPGKAYARRFVSVLRIPDVFAGIPSDPKMDRMETAVPKADIKELKNFQKNMQAQIEEILGNPKMKDNRAIVTLPTGAGKTRTVVEAIIQFLNKNGTDRNILWIAQNQEVCEQAVVCFKQIWEQKGKGSELQIFRAWGNNEIPSGDERGVIVAGIQKLDAHKKELNAFYDQGALKDQKLSGIFIDEAHHSTTESYRGILENLQMSPILGETPKENDLIPLIGLTATPERKKDNETEYLRRMYGEKRIYPKENYNPPKDKMGKPFANKWSDLLFMKRRLTEFRFLAKPTFHGIDPGKVWKLNHRESKDQAKGGTKYIDRLATDEERNRNIKTEILKWANREKKILYFGTNVTQASIMARLLENDGHRSVCITANTRYAARKMYVDIFNKKDNNEIQVMCNYNVLATGFDSPQVDVVIIARPTTSVVAYQQMVGRGLRGEEFGGKKGNKCDIVTVKDNIEKFNNRHLELGWETYDREMKGDDE